GMRWGPRCVALERVVAREYLEVRDSRRASCNLQQSRPELHIRQVVQHAAAHYKIVGIALRNGPNILNAAQPDVSAASKPAYCILAWINAFVRQRWSKRMERRTPVSFATSNVQHSANCTSEHPLCRSKNKA